MTFIICIIAGAALAAVMALLSAAAGGSLPGSHLLNKQGAVDKNGRDLGGVCPVSLTWLPEALYCLPFGVALGSVIPAWWAITAGFVAVAVSYAGKQAATGPALPWGHNKEQSARRQRISPVVNWISDRLGFERGDVNYCRTWMAVKGFIITLPVGGVIGAITWPLGFEIGYRQGSHLRRELYSGLGGAVAIIAFLVIIVRFL